MSENLEKHIRKHCRYCQESPELMMLVLMLIVTVSGIEETTKDYTENNNIYTERTSVTG